MDFSIVPIAEEHIPGFRAAVDSVAREHRFLAFLEAPPFEECAAFVRGNIRLGAPQFAAVVGAKVVGWCDVLPIPRPIHAHAGVLGMGVISGYRGCGIGTALIRATLARAQEIRLTRVELTVRERNVNAVALYEKIGFVFEGLKRKSKPPILATLSGSRQNGLLYALFTTSPGGMLNW